MLDWNFVLVPVLSASCFTSLFEYIVELKSLLTLRLTSLQVLSFSFFCRVSFSAPSFKIVDVSKSSLFSSALIILLISFMYSDSRCFILFTVSMYLELAGLSLQGFSLGIAGFGALFALLLFFYFISVPQNLNLF